MSRHLADKRSLSTGGRLRAFMQIARGDRGAVAAGRPWHRPHHADSAEEVPAASRLQHYLRIARGRLC